MSEDLFKNIRDNYPELLTCKDLIKLGIYSGQVAAFVARRDGVSPSFIRIKSRILYPKLGVIRFLKNKLIY